MRELMMISGFANYRLQLLGRERTHEAYWEGVTSVTSCETSLLKRSGISAETALARRSDVALVAALPEFLGRDGADAPRSGIFRRKKEW